jgi:16S rRNA A1518/A1519 N6-dimethyltransferase RsmA/KsgA/DIM1 with predicted DNA glycosylase/AP lyase activity
MSNGLEKDFQYVREKIDNDFEESKRMLKNNFKFLYENAGMEWTEKNEKEIDYIFESILQKATCEAVYRVRKAKIDKIL